MEKDAGQIFRKIRKDTLVYLEAKLELLKLATYESVSKVIAVLSYAVILSFTAFFVILFIFLALGFYLGDLFGSFGAGFAVVAALYLILIGLIILLKNKVRQGIQDMVITALINNEEKKNDANNEQTPDTAGEIEF